MCLLLTCVKVVNSFPDTAKIPPKILARMDAVRQKDLLGLMLCQLEQSSKILLLHSIHPLLIFMKGRVERGH
jgi:hypothetical protein